MTGDDAAIKRLVAESAINRLLALYADAAWRLDADAAADLYAEDGEWKVAGRHFTGREAVRAAFAQLLAANARVRFIAGTPLLEINLEAGTATGRLPVTELVKARDGAARMNLGIYYDWYVREETRWRFRRRHFAMHYRGPVDFSGDLAACPDHGPPPGLPGLDEPAYINTPA